MCSFLWFCTIFLSSAKILKNNETSPLWRRQDTSATMKKTDSAKCVWQSPFFNYSIADA